MTVGPLRWNLQTRAFVTVDRRGLEPLTGRVQSPPVIQCGPRTEPREGTRQKLLRPGLQPFLTSRLHGRLDRHDLADCLERRRDLLGRQLRQVVNQQEDE